MRLRLRSGWLVVVGALLVGAGLLLGSGGSVSSAEEEGAGSSESAADSSGSCPDAPDTFVFDKKTVDSSDGSVTCHYTRSGDTTLEASSSVAYSCPDAPATFVFDRRDDATCHYTRTGTTTRTASSSTSYRCPSAPTNYTYSRRSGSTCYYTRTLTTTRTADASTSYSCPSAPSGYTSRGRSGTTCNYSRTLTTTKTASSSTSYPCPSAPANYSYSRRSGNTCFYSRTLTKTKTARYVPMFGLYCPKPPSGYSHSRRDGRTCYYTRTLSTTRTAPKTTTYTCPSAPTNYTYSSRSGSTCHYKRIQTTTRTATTTTTYTCPSAPTNYAYSSRSGSTCHYTRTLSTTRAATRYTTYTCPSAPSTYTYSHRVGSTCHYTRPVHTTREATATTTYTCPPAPSTYTYNRRVDSTCHYTRPVDTTLPGTPTATTPTTTAGSTTTTATTTAGSTTTTATSTTVSTVSTTSTTVAPGGRHPRPSLLSSGGTLIPGGSVSAIRYNAVSFTGIVTSAQVFNDVQYYYECKARRERRTRDQNSPYETFTSSTATPSPLAAPVTRQTVTWTFSIGTGTGQCVHDKNIIFSARVRDTSSGTRWSRWVNTKLPINPPPPADPPEGVEADGDSRGLSGSGGQSKVKWRGVENASSYKVKYCCTGDEKTDWSSALSTSRRNITIPGLDVEVLYQIQVKAVNVSGESGWSDTIYTYPTRTPATRGDTVGIVPILGFTSSSRYWFTICDITESSSSKINDSWETQVENGMETWEDATGRMVRVRHKTAGDCTSDSTNTVERVSETDIESRMWCDTDGTIGCAKRSYSPSVVGQIDRTRVGLHSDLEETSRVPTGETATERSCTRLFQVAMHEAGHALGLHDHSDTKSLMFSSAPYCFPTAHDIVAIKAIYQSR